MSEDAINFRPDVDETDLDRAISASTLALSVIPTIGPLIAEAVKHGIPNQRIDRIARMLKFLDRQVADMQEGLREQRMRTDEFRDLLEDALWQTTRTLTDERRAYIASILKNSIKGDDLAHEQEKELLSLLGQLNDSELIILGWYGTEYVGEKADEYFRRHQEVLYSPLIQTNASEEELRDAALKEVYRAKLRRLGLARPGKGKLDQITELGRMLLRQIEFYSLEP
jgi:Spy/CpxP family protein refolding chaperone